jgi:hypothetical protein
VRWMVIFPSRSLFPPMIEVRNSEGICTDSRWIQYLCITMTWTWDGIALVLESLAWAGRIPYMNSQRDVLDVAHLLM